MVWIYTDAEEWVDISEEELEWLNLKWPIISAGKDVDKVEYLDNAGVNINWYNPFGRPSSAVCYKWTIHIL